MLSIMDQSADRFKQPKLACLVLSLVALAACAGGSSLPSSIGAPSDSASRAPTPRGYLRMRIRVPSRVLRGRRSPRYISPGTQSIAIAILNAAQSTVASVQQNLTPSSPGCTPAGGSPAACEISIPLAPGSYSANITTYAGTGETGSVLSETSAFPFKIAVGSTNDIPVVLDGVPAFVQIIPETSALFLGGTQVVGFQMAGLASQAVDVFGRDADGNVILGSGAPVVALASNSPHVTVARTGQANPNQFVLTRSGTQSTPISLTASASPAGGGTAATSVASLSFAPLAYVFQTGGIGEYVPWSDAPVRVLTANLSGKSTYSPFFQQNQILTLDAAGNLYALDVPGGDVVVYPPGSVRASRVISNGIFGPVAMALDAAGNVYVANQSNVTVYSAGTATLARTIQTGISFPVALAVDSAGALFVANYASDQITKYASGATSPSLTISNGVGNPYGVALDASNDVYVGSANNAGDNTVTTYAPASTSVVHTYSLGATTTAVSDYLGGLIVDAGGDFCVSAPAQVDCGNSFEGAFVSQITGFPLTTNTNFSNAMTFDAAGKLYVLGGKGGTNELRVFPSFAGNAFTTVPSPSSAITGSTLVFGIAVQD
jgi:hypothetical protein